MEIKQNATERPMGQRRITREIKKYLETNENGNTIYQNLKLLLLHPLREKFNTVNVYLKKQEKNLK